MSVRRGTPVLAVLVLLLWPAPGQARSFRVNLIPNGLVFGCNTCHDIGGGGPRNPFGQVVEEVAIGSQAFWSQAMALLDSDNDGFTNGEELGDPDGDGVADPLAMVANPGDPDSIPLSPPTLRLLEPREGTVIPEGGVVLSTAEADDPDGVLFVEFRWREAVAGQEWVTRDASPPYQDARKLGPGTWDLRVTAVDIHGAAAAGPARRVIVLAAPPLRLAPLQRLIGTPLRWRLAWQGGVGPFEVQYASTLDGTVGWRKLANTSLRELVAEAVPGRRFYRVVDLGR